LTVEATPFWHIGSLKLSNPLLLAPLSGISDLPFRVLAKEQGCALVCTEMISSEGLVRNREKTAKLLKSSPEEHPLAVQIFGVNPAIMAEAARIIASSGADVVDINMGCPVRKVVAGGAGAALLKDLNLARAILQAVRKAVFLPLTIKIRSGWNEKHRNALEVAKMAEECGVDAVTIHGRTRTQGYGVKADWKVIAQTREHLSIPVIGNGDLTSPQAIKNFFAETGCPGAMIGRGALGNPWIFQEGLAMLRGQKSNQPSLEEREIMVLRHLKMMVELRGEVYGPKEFRKHLIWYTRGLRDNALFHAQIHLWKTPGEVAEGVQEYFRKIRAHSLFS